MKAGGLSVNTISKYERLILPDSKNYCIMIAEDNAVNQRVAVKQLDTLGYRSVVARNGKEVLTMLDEDIALILMDCQMPELDGLACTIEIRKREKATGKRVPILAMTGNTMDSFREQCLASEMDGYIIKPVKISTLRLLLQQWLPQQ